MYLLTMNFLIAIEQVRHDTGAYPRTLAEIPGDWRGPCTNKTLGYQKDGNEIRVMRLLRENCYSNTDDREFVITFPAK